MTSVPSNGGNPRTFVLIHSAWHGGWCWRRVSDLLARRGYRTLSPTLTGLGERSHLMNPAIDLDTHTHDIVNAVRWENLDDIVLVAHSYGGFVAAGVLEALGPLVSSLVLVDAFFPRDGEAMIDVLPSRPRQNVEEALAKGEMVLPPRPAASFRINDADREWVDSMCTPQPLGTFLQRRRIQRGCTSLRRKAFVRATDFPSESFDQVRDRLQSTGGWEIYDVACGHDVMLDDPEALSEILHLQAQWQT
ncbi:alpha/beta fold hydrolase [Mesorhizobium sp. 1B3]|uniref:alpha/beta fold hydrolase n=1 Tax=Mesorhizobium sp. 1B3 TaxID=3243599 RepID=UPI003D959C51